MSVLILQVGSFGTTFDFIHDDSARTTEAYGDGRDTTGKVGSAVLTSDAESPVSVASSSGNSLEQISQSGGSAATASDGMLKGDVNLDGLIDILDITRIALHIVETTPLNTTQLFAADASPPANPDLGKEICGDNNGNGSSDDQDVNVLDMIAIARGILSGDPEFFLLLRCTPEFAAHQLIVQFKQGVSNSTIAGLISQCGTEVLFDTSSIIETASQSPDKVGDLPLEVASLLAQIFLLRIVNQTHTVTDTITCFEAHPEIVEFAQKNFVDVAASHQSNNYPNDPRFVDGSQWGLLNAGQPIGGNLGTIDADIDALQSWDLPNRDCSDVIVAVFDTGADLDHPDLVANLWTNPGEVAGNDMDDDGNIFVDDVNGFDFTQAAIAGLFPLRIIDTGGDGPEDTLPAANFGGHGTHVAGIIGAVGNNGIGVSGTCWTADLMIMRIGNPGTNNGRLLGATTYVLIEKFVFGQDIRVINFSYQNFRFLNSPQLQKMYNALAAADILFVKAAGNNNQNLDADLNLNGIPDNPEYPCNSVQRTANVICVAASNNRDTLATDAFGAASNADSNYGPNSVDLAAPGEDILSLHLAGGLAVLSGTSMAAPHVSGIAALAFSLFPAKTALQVKNDILNGSVGPPAASGVDRIKTTDPNTIFDRVLSDGRLRWPYTADLGDAPASYSTIASPLGGALHWDYGNEYFGTDATPEVDANTPPPLDQDPVANILPFVNQDFADEPIGAGNGGFVFFPPPPWAPGQMVDVRYDLCSDHLGILDADGGRYQGVNADRTIYVNGWFDLNMNGGFEPAELLLEDIISPPGPPPPPPKPANPNVTVNLHPILPVPALPPVFPPVMNCLQVSSSFTVPAPGGTPEWIRFRADFGEDIGVNNPNPVIRSDQTFPIFQHLQWGRQGEVEDFRPVEVDFFPNSEAVLTILTPFGPDNVTLTGPTKIFVSIGPNGEAVDTDGDGLDQVQAEMVQLELTGISPALGPVSVSLRDPAKAPFQRTLGEIEETVNNTPGTLDLPPFALNGTADSFFDVFFEVEVFGPFGLVLHNEQPKRMEGIIDHKPPGIPDDGINKYGNNQPTMLSDENGNPQITITEVLHIPNPPPIEIDHFPNSTAFMQILTPLGFEPVILTGPTTVQVNLFTLGDGDEDGLEEVQTEIISMELRGTSTLGDMVVRIRNETSPPNQKTLGEIEEMENTQLQRLDLPPFAPNGTATSFFDVFFEIQIGENLFHNNVPKRMQAVITHKPPASGEAYENQDVIELFDQDNNSTGVFIGQAFHIPNPEHEVIAMESMSGISILFIIDRFSGQDPEG